MKFAAFSFVIAMAIASIAAVVGWIMNIVKLVSLGASEITMEFVIRLVGIVIPIIGAIMGWL